MTKITTVFCDVGGVLGSDGWDHLSRKRAAEHFNLNWEDFETAHAKYEEAFDTGELTAGEYMQKVVFAQRRQFTREEFFQFMKNESIVYPESVQIIAKLAASGLFFLATINNESLELNQHRIAQFGLKPLFSAFFSSCYLGVRKPDVRIFERALCISNKQASEAVFIDDRESNLVNARKLGMRTVHFQSPAQMENELNAAGLATTSAQASSIA